MNPVGTVDRTRRPVADHIGTSNVHSLSRSPPALQCTKDPPPDASLPVTPLRASYIKEKRDQDSGSARGPRDTPRDIPWREHAPVPTPRRVTEHEYRRVWMRDERATHFESPSYRPLNEASIPDRRLNGYAWKAARDYPGRAGGSVWKQRRKMR